MIESNNKGRYLEADNMETKRKTKILIANKKHMNLYKTDIQVIHYESKGKLYDA